MAVATQKQYQESYGFFMLRDITNFFANLRPCRMEQTTAPFDSLPVTQKNKASGLKSKEKEKFVSRRTLLIHLYKMIKSTETSFILEQSVCGSEVGQP